MPPSSPMLYKILQESLEGQFVYILLAFLGVFGYGIWWFRGLHDDRKNFKEFMEKVEKKIDEIHRRLGRPVSEANSPLRLTEFGEQIARDIKIELWKDLFKDILLEQIEIHEPYEVQKFCFEYAQSAFLDHLEIVAGEEGWDDHHFIKDTAFDLGIKLEQVLEVVGIIFRDMILKELNLESPK